MYKHIACVLAFCSVSSVSAFSQTTEFYEMDSDQDGLLSLPEITAAGVPLKLETFLDCRFR